MIMTTKKIEELFNKSTGEVCTNELKELEGKSPETFNANSFVQGIEGAIEKNPDLLSKKNLQDIFGKNGVIEQLCSRLYTTGKSNFVKLVKENTSDPNFIQYFEKNILDENDINKLKEHKKFLESYLTLEKRNKNKNIGEKASSKRKSNRLKVAVTIYTIALIDTKIKSDEKAKEQLKPIAKKIKEKAQKAVLTKKTKQVVKAANATMAAAKKIKEKAKKAAHDQQEIQHAVDTGKVHNSSEPANDSAEKCLEQLKNGDFKELMKKLITRDLERLKTQLKTYPDINHVVWYNKIYTTESKKESLWGWNKWYGNKPTDEKIKFTLLFPTLDGFNQSKLAKRSTEKSLSICLKDPKNWEIKTFIKKSSPFLDSKAEINSITEYWDYLQEKISQQEVQNIMDAGAGYYSSNMSEMSANDFAKKYLKELNDNDLKNLIKKLIEKNLAELNTQLKKNSGTCHFVWYNKIYTDRNKVNEMWEHNKWYGNKLTDGAITFTLLFPTADGLYPCKVANYSTKESILHVSNSTSNWNMKIFTTSDSVSLEDKTKINSIPEYCDYLEGKGKI